EEELAVRAEAMEEGYKTATLVPLSTAERCLEAMQLCQEMADLAPPTMISDVGSGALMAHAGLKSAIYNVRINLPSISDDSFHAEVRGRLDSLLDNAATAATHVEARVEEALEA
ncbi:MAG: cyclodeaminase/cyclohydrolase family protein, partial [Gemmatimonadetes bacterium]|nr:cyclodeaminase/cyclohydrolase family protein [Gemmatimonadota bacterium]